ncbi:MAG: hypothetical protein MK116_10535 [Phycisphaerales bacterium]|nr:hypothetical protein [Phycisphaerales bacterium]
MATTPAFDLKGYKPEGDKKNSEFFHEFLPKVYDRRVSSGLDEMLTRMAAVMIQVDPGDGINYLEELSVMGPYRFESAHVDATHKIYVLKNCRVPEAPMALVFEPLSKDYEDDLSRLNMLYPLSRQRPHARYIGEIFWTSDVKATTKVLDSQFIRYYEEGESPNNFFVNPHMAFTYPSDFTGNKVGYWDASEPELSTLKLGEDLTLTPEEQGRLDKAAAWVEDTGVLNLTLGIDHLATRILMGDREHAILEFLSLSPHYFWGAYNIADQNSSTNVTRNPKIVDDKHSPAKVFTANNTPAYLNSIDNLPMPTEDFVRNYGRRMHHMAYEVKDGDDGKGEKNVDRVVGLLRDHGTKFLAHVVGECRDTPDLKQIFSKHSEYSILITEYVERCHHFKGFFTKHNVAALTAAAGADEQFVHGHHGVYD